MSKGVKMALFNNVLAQTELHGPYVMSLAEEGITFPAWNQLVEGKDEVTAYLQQRELGKNDKFMNEKRAITGQKLTH